jgi:hypothetical protein
VLDVGLGEAPPRLAVAGVVGVEARRRLGEVAGEDERAAG